MALKSTIHKVQLQLADIDHEHYADHALTLARHPSETDERMMLRVAAFALNAHQTRDLCAGDGTLAFGAGLASPDQPDLLLADFTGRKRLWIELGQPEDKPLAKACAQADAVRLYCFAPAADVWWRGIEGRLARLDNLTVLRVPSVAARALAALAERNMELHATLQEQVLSIGNAAKTVDLECARWK